LPPLPAVSSIAAGRAFADALAAGLLARFGTDPAALADVLVLLPNRRAGRSLREAFLRCGGGRGLVLPSIRPLAEAVEDEDAAFIMADADESRLLADLPPPVGDLRRLLILTQLVMAQGGESGAALPDRAASLAAALIRLMDQAETERCPLDGLADLVPSERLAAHWCKTLKFLKILTGAWPDVLEQEGAINPVRRQEELRRARAAAWLRRPPAGPVIAAGVIGAAPGDAELLAVIAGLPRGHLVLPGLDRDAPPEVWDAVRADESHPQHALARLLDHIGVSREQVAEWPVHAGEPAAVSPARARLVNLALLPAETAQAADSPGDMAIDMDSRVAAEALADVQRLDCADAGAEAAAIALILRESLETPGRTAALVTPDRTLARRVSAAMSRWDIAVNDSAGVPLARTPPAAFLLLLAECAATGLAPAGLLALLKHPLAAGGRSPAAFRRMARRLERRILRGPRPAAGFAGLREALAEAAATPGREAAPENRVFLAVGAFLNDLEERLGPFAGLMARPDVPLQALVRAHVAAAEALADTATESGPDRLWRGDDGAALSAFFAELDESACQLPDLSPERYTGLLTVLMAGRAVRPRYGLHPRLFIWGPLEARLQRADVMILGGLNEGVWPAAAEADPWLSRGMRASLGLPQPERRAGLAAHDFTQAFCAPRVVLTRACKQGGQPAAPSRWLARLDVLLAAAGLALPSRPAWPWSRWALADAEAAPPAPPKRPEPRPPVSARPRHLYVTRVESWMRNPYAVYARDILKLKMLEPLEAEPDLRERGQLLHQTLEHFLRDFPQEPPPDPVAHLLEIGAACLDATRTRPALRLLWWPRFRRIARWFADRERQQAGAVAARHAEITGSLEVSAPAGPFRLSARADRLDVLPDGAVRIIDYKTGSVPETRQIHAGLSPQLPLEAALVRQGGFPGISAGVTVAALEFWRLSGGDPAGDVRAVAAPEDADGLDAFADAALADFKNLVARFDDPATPYLATPRPRFAPRYDDYAHLARAGEWRGGTEGEGE